MTNCMFLKLERVTRRFADNFKHVSLMPKTDTRRSNIPPRTRCFRRPFAVPLADLLWSSSLSSTWVHRLQILRLSRSHPPRPAFETCSPTLEASLEMRTQQMQSKGRVVERFLGQLSKRAPGGRRDKARARRCRRQCQDFNMDHLNFILRHKQ